MKKINLNLVVEDYISESDILAILMNQIKEWDFIGDGKDRVHAIEPIKNSGEPSFIIRGIE